MRYQWTINIKDLQKDKPMCSDEAKRLLEILEKQLVQAKEDEDHYRRMHYSNTKRWIERYEKMIEIENEIEDIKFKMRWELDE